MATMMKSTVKKVQDKFLEVDFSTQEQKLGAGLVALSLLYGFGPGGKLVKEKRLQEIASYKKVQRVPSAEKVQDHPVISWLITNGSVFGLVYLKWKIFGNLRPEDSNLKNFLRLFFGSILTVDGAMAINWFLINKVYAHVPFFSDKRPKQSYKEILTDWLTCNFVVDVITAGVQVYLFNTLRKTNTLPFEAKGPFRPLRFLFRVAWMRFWVDFGFWAGHLILHDKRVYPAHKRHHEHNRTKLTTNYHFTWYDLMIEAFFPFFTGVVAHETMIGPLSEIEVNLLALYTFWAEINSHAGKALPTMGVLPPISPFFQHWDDWNSWAHEIHHNVLKCNYSISWWFDHLMGTIRWE